MVGLFIFFHKKRRQIKASLLMNMNLHSHYLLITTGVGFFWGGGGELVFLFGIHTTDFRIQGFQEGIALAEHTSVDFPIQFYVTEMENLYHIIT